MPSPLLERATAADDPAVRALLRRSPMDGAIRLTFEREPDVALAAAVEGDRHHLFVSRESDGGISGVCSRAVRRVWVNGREERIGYLGQLRTERPAASVRHLLAEGFQACRETRQADELPFDWTSIMADNLVARRLLERGLPGFPRYVPIAEFRTLVFSAALRATAPPAGVRIERGTTDGLTGAVAFLRESYRGFQLAPLWTEGDLRSEEVTCGLSIEDFVLALRGDEIVGCAALWNQQGYRQTVVRGYAPWLGALRPVVNAWNSATGQPRLPSIGVPLKIGTVSHLAVFDDEPAVALALLDAIAGAARMQGLELLTVGLAERRALFPFLRERLRGRVLESILYKVLYEEETTAALDDRMVHVEVATL